MTAGLLTSSDLMRTGGRQRLTLSADCTIRSAAELRAQLCAQLEHPAPVEIDGSTVEHIDAAGLQLLLAFSLDCIDRNKEYVWVSQSETLSDAIALTGLAALLESPGLASVGRGA